MLFSRSSISMKYLVPLACNLPQYLPWNLSNIQRIRTASVLDAHHRPLQRLQIVCAENKKRCLRCNTIYEGKDNSATACSFHGHTTGFRFNRVVKICQMNEVTFLVKGGAVNISKNGLKAPPLPDYIANFAIPLHLSGEKGLFAFAPPHQGIDGEWSDKSGVIVYRWNQKDNRPNTRMLNWKRRWSCCAEYDENAPPCRRGWHVSYDDGFTLH